ncbi:KamA family radical SAM protein [Streptomyces natalensis]|uniref:KamA family radical SAM protein n=1 Tax=Streptomyces natalensis TaxID=68242 RepID=UPI00068DD854|nr:lysine 2,3-aminomutase [Streptomyces natalensis]
METIAENRSEGPDRRRPGQAPRMRAVPGQRLSRLPQLAGLDATLKRDIAVVSAVLPFKVNNYVIDELIDWSNIPDDPIFRMTFPHRDMLPSDDFEFIAKLMENQASREEMAAAVNEVRTKLNPHPGDQLSNNIPVEDDEPFHGLQHKYRETVLVFPAQGQTCHSYCGYCFRWAQFVGISELKQSVDGPERALQYLGAHREVSDVLITGGDSMIMSTDRLVPYIDPLLSPDMDHIRNIRFGTKALSYWPYRFTTDKDSDDLLRLFERCVQAGRHVAVMAHFSHAQELATDAVRDAIARIQSTGAVIRAQAPIIRFVNDWPEAWSDMWRTMVGMGVVPYYMFVERDTGARGYFEIPLARALEVYQTAVRTVSGLERTARGPVMSAAPGKVCIDGTATVGNEKVFVCRFLQARDPERVGKPFFARFDEHATWYDHLQPASFETRPWFATANSSSLHGS